MTFYTQTLPVVAVLPAGNALPAHRRTALAAPAGMPGSGVADVASWPLSWCSCFRLWGHDGEGV